MLLLLGSLGDVDAEELQSIAFAGKTEIAASERQVVGRSLSSAAHPNLHLLPRV